MAIYILFSLASGLIKLSILFFYRRLSSRTVSPAFRWTMRITIFAIGAYSVAFMIVPIFMCRPISAFWDQVDVSKVAPGYKYTCINEGMDVVAHGIVSTVQDLVVAILPTLLCWNLQIPRRQKIALYVIFALGYTSVAIGTMRTYQGYRLFFTTYDVTWVASDIWLWSLLELHIGSMCANAPALKIFFEKVLKVDRLSSWKRSKSRSHTDGSKKQNLGKKSKRSRWREMVSRLGKKGSTHNSCSGTSRPRDATIQDTNRPDTSDCMTKPFASEYIDTVVRYDSHVHDIEMNTLPTSQISLDDSVQALPSYQTPTFMWQKGDRPPPLSQVRRSWNVDGRRYVWKPWERNTRVIDVEHPEWV